MTELRETGRRIVFAGGGTGGHIYPGLAVAEAILQRRPDCAVAFLTTTRSIDAKVLEGVDLDVPVTPIRSRPWRLAPWTWPMFLVSLAVSGLQTRRRFREFCPDVVVGMGGFGSYAPVRVGRKTELPTALLNPDIVPGTANRRLAPGADLVACQFAETVEHFPKIGRHTGCPVRPSLLGADPAEAARELGLDPDMKTLLVTGGSSGARTLNRAVVAALSDRGLPGGWQVLHLSGELDADEVAAARERGGWSGVVRPYEHRMGLALAAADVAVARAGASTLAELTATATPAILLPYPFHRDQHQMRQARAVEAEGAAVVVRDRPDAPEATARDVGEALAHLLGDSDRLMTMKGEAERVGRPEAAHTVADAVLELADRATERRHRSIRGDVDNPAPAS